MVLFYFQGVISTQTRYRHWKCTSAPMRMRFVTKTEVNGLDTYSLDKDKLTFRGLTTKQKAKVFNDIRRAHKMVGRKKSGTTEEDARRALALRRMKREAGKAEAKRLKAVRRKLRADKAAKRTARALAKAEGEEVISSAEDEPAESWVLEDFVIEASSSSSSDESSLSSLTDSESSLTPVSD